MLPTLIALCYVVIAEICISLSEFNIVSFCSEPTKAAFNLILRAVQLELQCKYSI